MKATVHFGSGSVRALALALVLAASGAHAQSGPAKVDLAKGEAVASQVCAACHAADGNSPTPANPKLAGQHADYLYKQLMDFKVKQGAKEAARVNAIMAGFAAGLSEEDMRNVSAYLSKQALKPAAASNKDIVELGQKIYRGGIPAKNVPACAGCHSPNGAGVPSQYPRLAGQNADYTVKQLADFRDGKRANSATMHDVAAKLNDQELKALADYIAGLR